MRFVADEGVDAQIVAALRRNGFEVWYIAEQSPSLADDTILKHSTESGSILITADKDFGELVYLQQRASAGVVLLRLSGLTPATKGEIVVQAITAHGPELQNAFSVIAPGLLRIRQPFDSR